jgi:transglutaminase-like putative cysteine protease
MQARGFGIFGIVCAALFLGLLGVKAGWFDAAPSIPDDAMVGPDELAGAFQPRDVWINIRQGGHKIGFGHEEITATVAGLLLRQRLRMRLKTLGLIQEIRMQTEANLNPDFSLKDFSFNLQSGSFHTKLTGVATSAGLRLTTISGGETRQSLLPLEMPLYLPAGITAALGSGPASPGDERHYPLFDPATMGQASLRARYQGTEAITLNGRQQEARHWRLSFKGATQSVWLGTDGDVLREEGILGISLERTTRDEALRPPDKAPADDLIRLASIAPDRPIDHAEMRQQLQVALTGIPPDYESLMGGRQHWDGHTLTVKREDAAGNGPTLDLPPQPGDLAATALVESDHPKIQRLGRELGASADSDRARVENIMAWLAAHIERRPVVSIPSAVATLEQGRGDCNEHAVLFAALARAMGIPTQVEAGIVYLEGRFYYHAWNRVYLDRWLTVDALFGQLPADVTHIRLARGSIADQLDLVGVMGRLKIRVLDVKAP